MESLLTIQFSLPVKPLSVNNAYFRNRQYNKKAREYRKNFLLALQEDSIQHQLDKVKALFNPKKHALKVEYHFFFPYDILFTKSGWQISSRSFDLTNIEKLPQDFIFNSKYLDREIDGIPIKNLDLDDKYIVSLISTKNLSPQSEHQLTVNIHVVQLLDLRPV